jgi:hypothetical protein
MAPAPRALLTLALLPLIGAQAPNPNPHGAQAPNPNPHGAQAPNPNPHGAQAPNPNPHGSPVVSPTIGFKTLRLQCTLDLADAAGNQKSHVNNNTDYTIPTNTIVVVNLLYDYTDGGVTATIPNFGGVPLKKPFLPHTSQDVLDLGQAQPQLGPNDEADYAQIPERLGSNHRCYAAAWWGPP